MKPKYTAASVMLTPRVSTIAHPGSTTELLIRAVLLGFGKANVTIAMPDGTIHHLTIYRCAETEGQEKQFPSVHMH